MVRKILLSPFFIFPAFACLLFWPLSFQLYTVKNDALSYYYPVRTLISDALNNGELPLWTPFINLGYPLHADLQSGAWNPVIWIFAFLTKYSLGAFHAEFIFYVAFAGIGFYFLCKQLGSGVTGALLFGLAYQGSGFMTDSVQFFNCISAACYLPFILLFFIRLLKTYRLQDGLLLAIFLWLMLTGGYPSIFIITIYCMLIIWIREGCKQKDRLIYLKRTALHLAITGTVFFLLSLPAIISFYHHLDFIERGGAQSLATVLENSMNPATSLSLLSPFATTASDSFLNSSILMRSIYIGILPLTFVLLGLSTREIRKRGAFIFYLLIAIVMLGMAWGEFFVLRQAAYYLLPLMDSFRHPGLFRLFFIFFLLLAARHSFDYLIHEKNKSLLKWARLIKYTFGILALSWIIFIIWQGGTFWNQLTSPGSRLEKFYELNFAGRFISQMPVVLVVLALTYWFVVKRKQQYLLVPLLLAEIFIATQFNLPVTVIGATSFTTMTTKLNRNPVPFPIPGKETIENSIAAFSEPNYISNPLHFEKRIGRNDIFITPGNLKAQDSFYYSDERIRAFKKPVIYFKETTDSGYNTDNLVLTKFSANTLALETTLLIPGELVYQQNYYPGWKCYINEVEQPIRKIYKTEMLVTIPAGKSQVKFVYKPNYIHIGFYISTLVIIAIFIWLIFVAFAKRRSMKPPMANAST